MLESCLRDDCRVGLLACGDSVLVVVDVQPGFLARPPWFSERDAAAAGAALERVVWLVALAARLGIPVVVTEEEPERNGPTDPRVAERLPAGTPTLCKPTFGLAGTPEILAAVRESGRGTVVVVGCETDVCVAQSAIGLREHDLGCVVVADATFSPRGDARPRPRAAGLGRRRAQPRKGRHLRVAALAGRRAGGARRAGPAEATVPPLNRGVRSTAST
jgi:nicotinamidase-related amidase